MNPEVFYLQENGAQRGPYTVAQIDHLLNARLISKDSRYWREGMEGWHPVTELVQLRTRLSRWVLPAVLIALLLGGLAAARVLGPTIMVGWRETAQYEYTPRAAYWRARDAVRQHALPPGAIVVFHSERLARTDLRPDSGGATVWLDGDVTGPGGEVQVKHWRVELAYRPTAREWSGQSAIEAPRP